MITWIQSGVCSLAYVKRRDVYCQTAAGRYKQSGILLSECMGNPVHA
jgi:hypothetical protein